MPDPRPEGLSEAVKAALIAAIDTDSTWSEAEGDCYTVDAVMKVIGPILARADSAQRTLAALRAWLPIETAPKDGTRILIAHTEPVCVWPVIAWWGVGIGLRHATWTDGGSTYIPNLWMPLPDPPLDRLDAKEQK